MEAISKAQRPARFPAVHRRLYSMLLLVRASIVSALDHDCLTLAQATAYSAIVSLFPALIVAAAVIGLMPPTLPFRSQMAMFFTRILPSNVSPLLQAYFVTTPHSPKTSQALAGSVFVSVVGAANVMATLMESFRRAYDLPLAAATFWQRRRRALLLVPLSLLPMTVASLLVVFGHVIWHWLSRYLGGDVGTVVFVFAVLVRWSIALAGSIGIIAVVYHLGTDLSRHMREYVQPLLTFRMDWSWRQSLPGAVFATILWFLSTLLFGLYVTRFANYSQVYGSLGAAIALLFWLYLIALSVICGAEFNAQVTKAASPPPASPLAVEEMSNVHPVHR